MRVVSFLPAATEMLYLLGSGDDLVGRSHECDFPEEVRDKPVLVDCALDLS
jgi:iron complex transport system substrate-binding protein